MYLQLGIKIDLNIYYKILDWKEDIWSLIEINDYISDLHTQTLLSDHHF
jgi:hypothetical protein